MRPLMTDVTQWLMNAERNERLGVKVEFVICTVHQCVRGAIWSKAVVVRNPWFCEHRRWRDGTVCDG